MCIYIYICIYIHTRTYSIIILGEAACAELGAAPEMEASGFLSALGFRVLVFRVQGSGFRVLVCCVFVLVLVLLGCQGLGLQGFTP